MDTPKRRSWCAWLLRRAATANTLARPIRAGDVQRDALEHARRDMRNLLAPMLHAPQPARAILQRIATAIGEPLDLPPEASVQITPGQPPYPQEPPTSLEAWQASNDAFEHNKQVYAQHIRTQQAPAVQSWPTRMKQQPGRP